MELHKIAGNLRLRQKLTKCRIVWRWRFVFLFHSLIAFEYYLISHYHKQRPGYIIDQGKMNV
jgi:hypothetical protein